VTGLVSISRRSAATAAAATTTRTAASFSEAAAPHPFAFNLRQYHIVFVLCVAIQSPQL
jgi:hypothetical protein